MRDAGMEENRPMYITSKGHDTNVPREGFLKEQVGTNLDENQNRAVCDVRSWLLLQPYACLPAAILPGMTVMDSNYETISLPK